MQDSNDEESSLANDVDEYIENLGPKDWGSSDPWSARTTDFEANTSAGDGPELKAAIDLLVSCAAVQQSPTGQVPSIPGFEIQRLLGRGGMGVVYAAKELGLDRPVAIKFLNDALTANGRAKQRFQIETHAAARLQHPNIVSVFSSGLANERPYYCMQLIEGVDLAHKLTTDDAQHGPQLDQSAEAVQWTVGIGVKIAQALHHAHQNYILHRDIKPANILIDRSGSPWVVDFGLARLRDSELTATSDLVGSLRYMSPEQVGGRMGVLSRDEDQANSDVSDSANLDHRTDLYSLGVTLIELLTGKPFISANSPAEIVARIANRDRPKLAREVRFVSRDLETVLHKAIERDPGDRYESLEQFAGDLSATLEGRPVKARRIGGLGRAQRWLRRNPRVTWTTAALASVLLIVGSISIIQVAKRFASDNLQIRRQYASLLDANGVEAMADGDLAKARALFEQVAETTPDAAEGELQSKRLELLKQQELSRGPVRRFSGTVMSVSASVGGRNLHAVVPIHDSNRVEIWNANWDALADEPERLPYDLEFELPVRLCRFAPRAGYLALLVGDRTNENQEVHLVDTQTGASMIEPIAFDRRVVWLSFTADEKHVLAAGWDGQLTKWDVSTGELVASIDFSTDDIPVNWVYAAAMDRARTIVAVALANASVRVIDIATMKDCWSAPNELADWHTDVLKISRDSRFVLAGELAGTATVWDAETGVEVIPRLELGSAVVAADFSIGENQVAISTADRTTHLLDLSNGRRLGKTLSHGFPVTYARYDDTGRWLTVAGGGYFQTWSTESQRPTSPAVEVPGIRTIGLETIAGEDGRRHRVYRATARVDGDTESSWWQVSAWEDSTVEMPTSVESLELFGTADHLVSLTRLEGSSDLVRTQPWPLLAASMSDANIGTDLLGSEAAIVAALPQILAILPAEESLDTLVIGVDEDGQQIVRWVRDGGAHLDQVVSSSSSHFQISKSGKRIAVGGFSKKVEVYEKSDAFPSSDALVADETVQSLSKLVELRHDSWTTDVVFTDDNQVVTAAWDGSVRLWDLDQATQAVPKQVMEHRNVAEHLALRERLLVVGTWGGEVSFWKLAESGDQPPQKLKSTSLHRGTIQSLAISEDGTRVVSGGSDAFARLWGPTGELIASLSHESPVKWCSFAPVGETLATLTAGGEIRLWDSDSGRPLSGSIRGPSDILGSCWSQNRLWVTGRYQGRVWVGSMRIPEAGIQRKPATK